MVIIFSGVTKQKRDSSKQQCYKQCFGSGALSGKMLLLRIFENNKIDAYFRVGWLSKGWLCPVWLGKWLG